jgi:hypothetical protein
MRTVVSGLLGIAVGLAGFSAPVFARNAPSHIVIVIEENHGADQIVGNPNMPYLNKTLIAGGLLLTNSHGVQHPSQPNYLDLFSGSDQRVTNDGPVFGSSSDPFKQTALTSGNIAGHDPQGLHLPSLFAIVAVLRVARLLLGRSNNRVRLD